MLIIPTLYLLDGKAVSLYKGQDNKQKKIYKKPPRKMVLDFHNQGAKTIQIVDLDARHREQLAEFKTTFKADIWWAGQVRDLASIQSLLDSGASRVILGLTAMPIFEEALKKFGPEKIIIGLKVQGDEEETPDLCSELSELGVKHIIVNDFESQGTLFHPNFDVMEKCGYFSKANVYASGGIAHETHIELLKQAGVKGVIIGRALYEEQLDLVRLRHRFEGV